MIVKVKGKKLKENVYYRGIISQYKVTDSKLIISVIFNKDSETEYIKSVKIEDSVNSAFVNLAQELEIINEDGNVDTDYLDDLHVIACLQRGYDDRLYIDKMILDEKYYKTAKEDEEEESGEEDE